MSTISIRELESALEKWINSTRAATKGYWNRFDGFWLVSEPYQVHFRLRFDGIVEIELLEGEACKVAPVTTVDQALAIVDDFLRRHTGFASVPGGAWKTLWNGIDVPAQIIDHPESITVEDIDNQPAGNLRTAMIGRYGVQRYWQDAKLKSTGFIHEPRHIENVIEKWRASWTADIQVEHEVVSEDDIRNREELIIVRSGNRHVTFGEPILRQDYRVDVCVSDGNKRKVFMVSRREEVEKLLDLFLRQHCRLEEVPDFGWSLRFTQGNQ
jgi:hypothetical protein